MGAVGARATPNASFCLKASTKSTCCRPRACRSSGRQGSAAGSVPASASSSCSTRKRSASASFPRGEAAIGSPSTSHSPHRRRRSRLEKVQSGRSSKVNVACTASGQMPMVRCSCCTSVPVGDQRQRQPAETQSARDEGHAHVIHSARAVGREAVEGGRLAERAPFFRVRRHATPLQLLAVPNGSPFARHVAPVPGAAASPQVVKDRLLILNGTVRRRGQRHDACMPRTHEREGLRRAATQVEDAHVPVDEGVEAAVVLVIRLWVEAVARGEHVGMRKVLEAGQPGRPSTRHRRRRRAARGSAHCRSAR
mmetsp:Transcript_21364/g.70623  ORF Transcript_21364/g.70623 Transcript_21364/m.70623 type:complete len:309 (-) Transcript_21364:235-1161(-)